MVFTQQIQKSAKRIDAAGTGVLSSVARGAGNELLMKAIDNIFGSPAQRFASIQLPLIGPVGIIDVINYIVVGKGKLVSKNGIIAVAGSKAIQGALPLIPRINLGGGGSATGGSTAQANITGLSS